VPLYQCELTLPVYREGANGRWKLIVGNFALDRGYYSGAWGVQGMPALLRRSADDASWETWMSLSPHEIESQELAVRYASGHTVVMGLGMGWAAANIALNPAVRRVTVVERDPEVLALFAETQGFAGLPADILAKIELVQADALDWQPAQPVDFLYADIWLYIEAPEALDQVRAMQAKVGAEQVYFWGQELAISRLTGLDPLQTSPGEWAEAVRRCVAEVVGLPLLLPEDIDYPALVTAVVRQRRARWPGGVALGGLPVA
jgi:hypothetical protein